MYQILPMRLFKSGSRKIIHDGYVNVVLRLRDDGQNGLQVLSSGGRAE